MFSVLISIYKKLPLKKYLNVKTEKICFFQKRESEYRPTSKKTFGTFSFQEWVKASISKQEESEVVYRQTTFRLISRLLCNIKSQMLMKQKSMKFWSKIYDQSCICRQIIILWR